MGAPRAECRRTISDRRAPTLRRRQQLDFGQHQFAYVERQDILERPDALMVGREQFHLASSF